MASDVADTADAVGTALPVAARDPLDVLIVCYDEAELLERCLRSVREHLPGQRVFVWNNRSPATPQIREIARRHPDVDWTFSPEGIGFAAGANRLVARSAEHALLLNPDAVLTGPLRKARAALAEDRVGVVAPLVVDPNGRNMPWDGARRRQTVMRILVNHAGYAGRLRGTRFSDLYPAPPHEVDGYLGGGCLLISRAALDDVGHFDERFFLYGEDADWQRRAHQRGWRLRLADEIDVRHGRVGVVDAPPAPRSADLLLANTALAAGGAGNRGVVPLITSGQLLLSRMQRSKRRLRRRVARLTAQRATKGPAVVITTTTLEPGSARRHRVLVANELSRRGHPVTVVGLDGFGILERQLDFTIRLAMRTWWQPVLDLVGDDAVLISGESGPERAFAAAWSRLPGGIRRRWVTWAGGTGRALSPLVVGRCAGVVIPGVVDHPAPWPLPRRMRRFAVPLGLDAQTFREPSSSGPLRIGVADGAGLPTVLDAALRASGPCAPEPVILGDAARRFEVRSRLRAAFGERLDFRAWTPLPAQTFAGLDAVCLPDSTANAALVALDAMACGTPVIAPATPTFADLLDEGRSGVGVPTATLSGWVEALETLDRAGLAQRGRHAMARVGERYPLAATVDAYETVFAEVLAAGR